MIDTIILTVPRENFSVLADEGRLGTDWELSGKTAMYEKWVRNPKRAHKETGNYYPRITGYRRNKTSESARIEFSIPKLIFGNNLDEVCDADFPLIVSTLRERLLELGIVMTEKVIRSAKVLAFHPSKNIPLSDGYTSSLALRELSKINLAKRFDLNKSDFRNSGQSLQGYTAAHSLVFYDKIADLAKPEKRAIDKDQTVQQPSLFQEIQKKTPELEVLRMEVRLSRKQKMNEVLKKLGRAIDPTFEDVFSKYLCKIIVADYWASFVTDKNLFLFDLGSSPPQILRRLLAGGVKPKEAIYLIGLTILSREEGGIREVRAVIEKKHGTRGWYRVAEGLKRLNMKSKQKQCHSWVRQVTAVLEKFDSFRFARASELSTYKVNQSKV